MDITQSQILLKIECNGGPTYKKMPSITEKESKPLFISGEIEFDKLGAE